MLQKSIARSPYAWTFRFVEERRLGFSPECAEAAKCNSPAQRAEAEIKRALKGEMLWEHVAANEFEL